MLKKVWEIIRKVVVSTLLIYGLNLLIAPMNLMIPINIITVLSLTILGIPALCSLVLILVLVF